MIDSWYYAVMTKGDQRLLAEGGPCPYATAHAAIRMTVQYEETQRQDGKAFYQVNGERVVLSFKNANRPDFVMTETGDQVPPH